MPCNPDEKTSVQIRLYLDQVEVLKSMHRSGRAGTAAVKIVERAIEEHQKSDKS